MDNSNEDYRDALYYEEERYVNEVEEEIRMQNFFENNKFLLSGE